MHSPENAGEKQSFLRPHAEGWWGRGTPVVQGVGVHPNSVFQEVLGEVMEAEGEGGRSLDRRDPSKFTSSKSLCSDSSLSKGGSTGSADTGEGVKITKTNLRKTTAEARAPLVLA